MAARSHRIHVTVALLAGAVAVAHAPNAHAKDIGIQSPSGRRIYDSDETFEEAKLHDTRRVVAEVSMGLVPEGNLGFLLGVLNVPIRHLDLYGGVGFELNPSRQFTGTARYTFDIYGYRPYLSFGYVYRDLYKIGGYSHNLSFELGYTWAIHQTMRVSVGAGVRQLLHFGLRADSPILSGYTDQALLDDQTSGMTKFTPIVAVRVSRAF